ncbi:tyrosine-type recombinase/integrase [Paraburkholderia caribensis]|uniref:tyrosine-type recombinase/integrase n=1 Tax=Paraburkholderia caribensis TaxID=75105 RepID=UPI003AACE100
MRRTAETVADPQLRTTLLKASTRWLRHTFGRHALASGVSVDSVQKTLGYASIEATSAYLSPADKCR